MLHVLRACLESGTITRPPTPPTGQLGISKKYFRLFYMEDIKLHHDPGREYLPAIAVLHVPMVIRLAHCSTVCFDAYMAFPYLDSAFFKFLGPVED
ncbi:hypothetical protein LAZ67_16000385 [Cordylochernes scorpioides]|uniref:Uncharacterized protein n=1 Tax=Cordylochernes scorpioides TaxID=51811 RepID=A0ABY6LD68_9ARAC|nr:hypothetical protein LAZ67_16000385 [Cordylochernes scorpioides]